MARLARYTEGGMRKRTNRVARFRRLRRNPAKAAALAGTTVPGEALPVEETNLTPEERALLPDPDWVTEDDADAIIGLRRERTEKPVPLARVLKRYGYRVEG